MNITSLTLWHLPLTSHIAYNMSDGKICDTVTSCILRLESDTGLTGWGEVCPIPHSLPANANGVAPALTELAPPCAMPRVSPLRSTRTGTTPPR